MPLLETRYQEYDLKTHLTIRQASEFLGLTYKAAYMWLRRHPEITINRVGDVLLVRKDELMKHRKAS